MIKTNVEIISELVKKGAVRVDDLKIKNVTVTVFESYTRLGVRIDREVDGYVADAKTGEMTKGKTDLIFLSTYAVGAVMRENDELATIVDHCNLNPQSYKLLLQGAKMSILQQSVKKDDEYVNPFSSKTDSTKMPHDTIIDHCIVLDLATSAHKWVEKIQDKMLGL